MEDPRDQKDWDNFIESFSMILAIKEFARRKPEEFKKIVTRIYLEDKIRYEQLQPTPSVDRIRGYLIKSK